MVFGTLEIAYDESVLVPRPWTVAQSRWAEQLMATAPAGPVLEICAGVGHIGLLAARDRGRRLVLVDADRHACELAARNAERVDLEVEIRCGRFEEVLDAGELFAVVIADPPWVPSPDVAGFPEDPVWAIDGGPDGLDIARACVDVIGDHLAPGGAAVLQLGTAEQVDRLDGTVAGAGLRVDDVLELSGGALALLRRAGG